MGNNLRIIPKNVANLEKRGIIRKNTDLIHFSSLKRDSSTARAKGGAANYPGKSSACPEGEKSGVFGGEGVFPE